MHEVKRVSKRMVVFGGLAASAIVGAAIFVGSVVKTTQPAEKVPAAERILTCKRVYTVYLRVGDAKEWLLTYCLTVRDDPRNTPFHIFVEAVGALLPP